MSLYFEKQVKATERADNSNSVRKAANYPCFKLVFNDGWNDYGYSTWFHLWYLPEPGNKQSLGDMKLIYQDNSSYDYLPDAFERLDDNFCSLGMNMDYYKTLLNKLGKELTMEVLRALCDCAVDSTIRERFETTGAYRHSLKREISAQQVLEDAIPFLEDEKPNEIYSIGYHFTPEYNKKCHIDWNVHLESEAKKYQRTVAIIGENGVGKTLLLSGMLKDLTEKRYENFSHKPLLKNILVLCSSVYDPYWEIKEDDDAYRVHRLSVVQDSNTPVKLKKSIVEIIKRGTMLFDGEMLRMDQHYRDLIKWQLGDEAEGLLIEEPNEDKRLPPNVSLNENKLAELIEHYSTGQLQIFTLITHVCAYIHRSSLVVLDEPEIHLHPRLVTDFFVCFADLLSYFKSYALVPTHSPLVIRECVNGNVYLMKRTAENFVEIGLVPFRTFGQDLTTLYENVFGYQETKTFFYQVVDEMASHRRATYDSVVSKLEEDGIRLDSNSRHIIKEVFLKKERENE